mmetsp:Transcript_39038/g.91763  ORF Transcript_39038/g.91763 Transcript_39038/m.91763 type:complete len:233 (-) Transcript_39038:19-717(-)
MPLRWARACRAPAAARRWSWRRSTRRSASSRSTPCCARATGCSTCTARSGPSSRPSSTCSTSGRWASAPRMTTSGRASQVRPCSPSRRGRSCSSTMATSASMTPSTCTASRLRARRCARRRAPPRSKPADSPRASHGPRGRALLRALPAVNRLLSRPRAVRRRVCERGSSAGCALRLPEATARTHASAQKDRGPTGRWSGVSTPLYSSDVRRRLRQSTHAAARVRSERRTLY